MDTPTKPKPAAKPVYGQPEKKDIKTTVLLWAFVVLGLGGIVWMIAVNPKEKPLNCRAGAPHSLTGFGSCTTD